MTPAHEIFRTVSQSASMMFTGGELKTKETDHSLGIGVRALDCGKLGFAYCQDEMQLEKAIQDANKASRFSAKSKFSFAPKSKFTTPQILDNSLDVDDFVELKGFVDEAKDAAESKGGKARVILGADRSTVALENTEGFSGKYDSTSFSLYVECMHGDGFGFGYSDSFKKPKEVRSIGLKAAEMAKAMQNAGKPDKGEYAVVFELSALTDLMDILLPSFSGDWKRRKMTKLAAGKRTFSEKLSLYDDGLAQGSAAQPFDDEGTPSKKRALVEKGVVRSFLYDRETAALEGVQESGACSRPAYDTPPAIGASNIVISPSDSKDFGALGKYIELHSAHGSHTANPTTGDFGLEASVAFLVDGTKRSPLKGFMLSGNVFELFSNIEAMEKTQQVHGNIIAPRIAFGKVHVVS